MNSTGGGRPGSTEMIQVPLEEWRRLSESEEQYRFLASHASDVVCRIGRDRRCEWVSPTITAALGWSVEDMVGALPPEFLHPDDVPHVLDKIRTFESGEASGTVPGEVAVRIRTKDGGYRWVSVHVTVLNDEAGFAGAVVGFQDVDELVRQRNETERLLAVVERLFASGSLLGVELESDGTLTWVSASISRMLGLEVADVIGQPAMDWVHPDDLERLDAIVWSLEEGDASAPVEFRLRTSTGEYRSFEGTATRSPGLAPGSRRFDLVLTDVTERRAAEQLRDQLVAMARLELRDPLSFVYGSLQLMEDGVVSSTDERGRAMVGKMRVSTQRLVNMVESLLRLE